MKNIIKIFGLPHSGTNIIHQLLNVNFTNYVCQKSHYNVHLFGWKHGTPKSIETYNKIESITKEKLLFIFTIRKYEIWKEKIKDLHGEFPPWCDDSFFIFNTPMGPEMYSSKYNFYIDRINTYKSFCNDNHDRTILIEYEDIIHNKIEVLEKIKKQFNLEQAEENWVTINKKKIGRDGEWYDT
jgi:hypothetical protein